jgi:hypothetical protein
VKKGEIEVNEKKKRNLIQKYSRTCWGLYRLWNCIIKQKLRRKGEKKKKLLKLRSKGEIKEK